MSVPAAEQRLVAKEIPGAAQPVLLLLKGPPGSGKSTLAAALSRALRWPLVDKDDVRSPFQPLVTAHPGVGIDWNELSYSVMWRVAEAQLRCGLSAVVDCPLARRSLFDRAAALAAQHGARLALVELEPRDAAMWRQRVELRGAADRGTDHAHKPGSWADIQAIAERNGGSEAWSEALSPGEVTLHCRLDSTAAGMTAQLDAVLAMLREGGIAVPAAALTPDGGSSSGSGAQTAAAPTEAAPAGAATTPQAAAAAQSAVAAAAQAAQAAAQASDAVQAALAAARAAGEAAKAVAAGAVAGTTASCAAT